MIVATGVRDLAEEPLLPERAGGTTRVAAAAASLPVLALVVLSALGPMLSFAGGGGDGSAVRQLLYLATFLAAAALTRCWEKPRRLFVIPVTVLLALAWCWLSLTWSLVPAIGMRRLILTSLIVWTAFLAVRRIGYDASMATIRTALIALLAVSYLMVLLVPTMAIHQTGEVHDTKLAGAWHGVFFHKNQAGPAFALLLLMLIFGEWKPGRGLKLVTAVATGFFLYMTHSKTSLGILGFATLVGLVNLKIGRARRLVIPVLLLVGVAGTLLIETQWDVLTAPLTCSTAFTGRPQIWDALLRYAEERPFTGSGYGSFWNIGEGRGPIYAYADDWVAVQVTGHNGYLDLLVQIGLPGLALAVLAFLLLPIGKLLVSPWIPPARGAFLIAALVFIAAHNMTESSLLDRDMFVFVFGLLVLAMIRCAARYPTGSLTRTGSGMLPSARPRVPTPRASRSVRVPPGGSSRLYRTPLLTKYVKQIG